MVRGIDKFKETFGDYTGQYVFIGGTACDIILSQEGISFRQTKDLDMVLIIEALDNAFISKFVDFIQKGGYSHINKGSGRDQFYRFEHPTNTQYPYMIELFSRKPEYLHTLDTQLSPIHVSDDAVSLSAILLDDTYYHLLVSSATVIDGISVLSLDSLILFKIKAWIDLSARKASGESVDSKNIKKHKNDIFRLAANLSPDTYLSIDSSIYHDLTVFLSEIESEPVIMKDIGLRGVTFNELLSRIRNHYTV